MNIFRNRIVIVLFTLLLALVPMPLFCQPSLPPLPPLVLDIWLLDQPDWGDAFGDPAISFTNLNVASGWDRDVQTALSVDTNCAAFLNYPVFDEGYSNLTFSTGTIYLWYQPNFTSTTDGGNGPTNWASLLTVGQWTSNASASSWILAIDPPGTNLVFLAQSNGNSQIAFHAPIDFDAGNWYCICLTYSNTGCCLYLGGQPFISGGAITNFPTTNDCATYGFYVGSEGSNGVFQARGQFQDLETYDGPMTALEIYYNYAYDSNLIANAGGILLGSGDGSHSDGSSAGGYSSGGSFVMPTNYNQYGDFQLVITNDPSNAWVSIQGSLSNLTYEILTNGDMSNPDGWGVWQVLLASNSITPAPPIALDSTNELFFEGVLAGSTGTNGLPDWWCMEYFGTLNVDPYADPDGDLLCNLDEYNLGTNPTNAFSLTPLHKDAQALFLAYTNFDSNCMYGLFITNPNTNTALVTMSNTLVGTNYQIYSHDLSDTNNTWIVETNFVGTNLETTVAITLSGRTLSFIGGYGADDDGDGLPDGYEVLATWTDPFLADTGITGTLDGYKDPDGDGYLNLQEMYNGTNPHVFNTPAGAQNLVADYSYASNSISFSWQAASGAVTEYIISVYNYSTSTYDPIATNSASDLACYLANASNYTQNYGYGGLSLSIGWTATAVYANGAQVTIYGSMPQYPVLAQSSVVHGPGGKVYLLVSALSTNVSGYFVDGYDGSQEYPESPQYCQVQETFLTNVIEGYDFESNFYISASQFTNGIAVLSNSQVPAYAQAENYYLTPELKGGTHGDLVGDNEFFINVPFLNGTAQMKQNVRFLLRAATSSPFTFFASNLNPSSPETSQAVFPTDYVYSGLYYNVSVFDPWSYLPYDGTEAPDHFAPFEDNYFYRNFVFDPDFINSDGNLETGFDPWYCSNVGDFSSYNQYTNAAFQFPTYSYVVNSNSALIPPLVSSNAAVGYLTAGFGGLAQFGVSGPTNALTLAPASNIYGLPYSSLELTFSNGTIQFGELTAANSLSGNLEPQFYLGTAQPNLQTVGYYFGRPSGTFRQGYYPSIGDPLPGSINGSFDVTNETPELMLSSVGNSMLIAGYAKQAVLNGCSNVFAYLGQYFTNAFVVSNGVVTTNSAGVLSEYGEFFPTVPGQAALMTFPDPDQTNIQGTCLVDIIRLSLDVNHDGIMDESYTGPDNTSSTTPFTFWANNDYDRWTYSLLDGSVEDDIQQGDGLNYLTDCNYTNVLGERAIPCQRDLEDYARLWVSGISSNVLSNLPPGSTVELWCEYNWDGDEYETNGNPTIDLFQAADADGGTGYLTNLTTATNQINLGLCPYIGRLGTGQEIQLNSDVFSNGWAGNHFIFCGVSNGVGNLNLSIYDSNGNVLAWSTAFIQIEDIKQMYERWTVGDSPPTEPMGVAVAALDNFSPGAPTTAFAYPYDPAYDTNDDYILFVHGYNMESWEKDRYAETMYKRLYWQGYQGRFGSFRWPTYTHFWQYDVSETQAWNSGIGLERLLAALNAKYPGNVYALAHSMGNVVTPEALRLAGTNVIVNTYVASQAAVSARAYDNTIPVDVPYEPGTPDSEGHYYTNDAPPYFNGINGAKAFVDFYNPGDWALRKWLTDQATKPDLLYGCTSVYSDDPFEYYYKTYLTGGVIPLYFPTNTYQIFSRCVQSYSLTLGAETNIASTFSTPVLPVDLSASPYSFLNTHPGHSQQFRFDLMTTETYWSQLLKSFRINNAPLE